MAIDLPLLTSLCQIPGAPGYEQRIRQFVVNCVTPLVDEWYVDSLGNIITLKKGVHPAKKKVMVAAHMDEIGFMVTHIDDKGFLSFHPLGGFDPKTLTAQRVIVHGKQDLVGVMGSKPIHVMRAEEKVRPARIEEFFIDLGMDAAAVKDAVEIGSTVTRERSLVEMGNCINCKSLDNRVSVYILIETLKQLAQVPYDVYGVFTVQEEVGLRGAHVAAHAINPDFGIALDTTIAYDVPGAKPQERITELGNGIAIKIMDSSSIADYRMVKFLKQTADNAAIKWQPEVLTAGGTDTAALQKQGKTGSIAGAISVPTRHIHQVIETVNKADIEGGIQLLKSALETIDQYDWNWNKV